MLVTRFKMALNRAAATGHEDHIGGDDVLTVSGSQESQVPAARPQVEHQARHRRPHGHRRQRERRARQAHDQVTLGPALNGQDIVHQNMRSDRLEPNTSPDSIRLDFHEAQARPLPWAHGHRGAAECLERNPARQPGKPGSARRRAGRRPSCTSRAAAGQPRQAQIGGLLGADPCTDVLEIVGDPVQDIPDSADVVGPGDGQRAGSGTVGHERLFLTMCGHKSGRSHVHFLSYHIEPCRTLLRTSAGSMPFSLASLKIISSSLSNKGLKLGA